MQHALSGLSDFSATQSCLGSGRRTGLAIDENARNLCLLKITDTQIERRIFLYRDLLGSEVVEDGYIIASTSGRGTGLPPSNQVSAERISRSHSSHDVELVALKLILNEVGRDEQQVEDGDSSRQPGETLVHIVRFLHKSTPREGQAHRSALTKAHDWHRLILALMHIVSIQSPKR